MILRNNPLTMMIDGIAYRLYYGDMKKTKTVTGYLGKLLIVDSNIVGGSYYLAYGKINKPYFLAYAIDYNYDLLL